MMRDTIIKILVFLAATLKLTQSLCVNSSILHDVTNLMEKITQHTIMAVNRQNSDIFRDMGHIGEVPNEFHDFAMAAAISGVETICEVGFNAGHSAGVFLVSNPRARVISFDLGNLAWSDAQVQYISSLFPNRLTYVKGNSQTKIKEYAMENPSVKCDLWSIDGDHGPNAELDFEGAHMMAAEHSFVLADDYSPNFPAVRDVWHRWEAHKNKIKTIFCHIEDRQFSGYGKGWCLGRFVHHHQKDSSPPLAVESASTGGHCGYSLPPPPPPPPNSEQQSSVSDNGNNDYPFSTWASCKYLVYTVVGADRVFNDIVAWNIKSLHASILRSPPFCKVDIAVFTDEDNFVAMAPLVARFGVLLHRVPYTADPMKSSMMKLNIFSYPQIFSYTAVLFVDADFLFNLEDLESVFSLAFTHPDKLHVSREPYGPEHFNSEFFGLNKLPVSKEEIAQYREKNITPFNAGIFLFQPNSEMKTHFDSVLALIESYVGTYYYEQSFLNYYFPRHDAVAFSITSQFAVSGVTHNLDNYYATLIHFTRVVNKWKASHMQIYVQKYMPWMDAILNSTSISNLHSASSCLLDLPWVHRGGTMKRSDCVVIDFLESFHSKHIHSATDSTKVTAPVSLVNGNFDVDIKLPKGATYEQKVPSGWSRLCCGAVSADTAGGGDGGVVVVAENDWAWGGGGCGSPSSRYYLALQTNGLGWTAVGQNVTVPPFSRLEVSFFARSRPAVSSLTGVAVSFSSHVVSQDLSTSWGYYVVVFPHFEATSNTHTLTFSGALQSCILGWDCSCQISAVRTRAILVHT